MDNGAQVEMLAARDKHDDSELPLSAQKSPIWGSAVHRGGALKLVVAIRVCAGRMAQRPIVGADPEGAAS